MSKQNQITELMIDVHVNTYGHLNPKSLCISNIISALKISSKGTKHESDVRVLLDECKPYIEELNER